MKKILLVAIAAVSLISCSGNASGEAKKENTTANVQPRKVGELKIAYYNLDSLQVNFTGWQEASAIQAQREQEFSAARESKIKSIDSYRQSIASKQQKGMLSQMDLQEAAVKIQEKEGAFMEWEQMEGGRIQQELAELSGALSTRIKEYAKEYCLANQIDILLVHSDFGSQFGYIDPSMDVTKEFTSFVNQKDEELLK